MIAVDTSALLAIALDEPEADACIAALEREAELLISAGTLTETLIVAAGRNVTDEIDRIIDGLAFDILPVTPAAARRVAAAYVRWGKGFHPAALNFGDCFSYDVAKEHACPLLFIGDDFAKTDIVSAL